MATPVVYQSQGYLHDISHVNHWFIHLNKWIKPFMYSFNQPIFTDHHPHPNSTVSTGNTAANGTAFLPWGDGERGQVTRWVSPVWRMLRKGWGYRAQRGGAPPQGWSIRGGCQKKGCVRRDLNDEEEQEVKVQRAAWEKASGGQRAHGALEELDHGKQGEAGAWV